VATGRHDGCRLAGRLRAAGAAGLHYELQTPWWHLHEAVRVAADFPETRIVINHAGMPSDRSEEGLRAWRTALAGMAAQPNVAIKISGIGEAGYQWRLDANRRVVLEVIDLFGVDRCMFGSNYPVDSLCASYQSIFDGFAACVADFSAQERAQLFVENARRIYRIAERGEWPADNFLIRGTRFNQGVLLKDLMAQGADIIGDPTQAHCVAIDARAPLYDGGIVTRVDAVSLGIMVNQEAKRFHDEGEDFWPKRYALWGRLVALQPGQIGYCVIDAKAIGRFMPPVFPAVKADTLPALAQALGLDATTFMQTLTDFNAACRVGTFDHTVMDDCHTEGLAPPKTHWARPIDTPPFYGYALRPGITFTYMGLKTDAQARVHFGGDPSDNLFVAGEMMAGNVLGKGYTAGVGMSIGTAFGRIAGTQAARAALKEAADAVA
jgi:hypothetical protein